jgi:hypothetical protein
MQTATHSFTHDHHLQNITNVSDTQKTTGTTTQSFPLPPFTRHNHHTMVRLMQAARQYPISPCQTIQLHIDGGANRSITNNMNHLINVRNIKPYYMSSASAESDIKCTAWGYLPWRSPNNDTLFIKCFYSQHAVDTIISPSDIVLNDVSMFHSWTQHKEELQHSIRTAYEEYEHNPFCVPQDWRRLFSQPVDLFLTSDRDTLMCWLRSYSEACQCQALAISQQSSVTKSFFFPTKKARTSLERRPPVSDNVDLVDRDHTISVSS